MLFNANMEASLQRESVKYPGRNFLFLDIYSPLLDMIQRPEAYGLSLSLVTIYLSLLLILPLLLLLSLLSLSFLSPLCFSLSLSYFHYLHLLFSLSLSCSLFSFSCHLLSVFCSLSLVLIFSLSCFHSPSTVNGPALFLSSLLLITIFISLLSFYLFLCQSLYLSPSLSLNLSPLFSLILSLSDLRRSLLIVLPLHLYYSVPIFFSLYPAFLSL